MISVTEYNNKQEFSLHLKANTEDYLMDLKDGDKRSLQIVGLGLLGVVDLNGMLSAFQVKNG